MTDWPVADLDGPARLRVLAAALPGVVLHERVLDHPVADVWRVVTDFEGGVPRWEADVSSARVRRRTPTGDGGERIDLLAHGPRWTGKRPVAFDVDLRPGWCWMVARRPQVYVVGMAASAADGGRRTRFAHLEGVVLPAPRWTTPVTRLVLAVSRLRHRHHVPRDVDGIERLLAGN